MNNENVVYYIMKYSVIKKILIVKSVGKMDRARKNKPF